MKNLLETVCFRITNACNLSCAHCRATTKFETPSQINLKALKKFVLDFKSLGLKHISISGGEPGLATRLGKITKWLLDNKFYVTITTNGQTPIINKLESAQVAPNTHLRIYVSIDGYKDVNDKLRGVGSFTKAIETASDVKEWAGWVGINTVALPVISSSMYKLIPLINKINVDRWALITPVKNALQMSDTAEVEHVLAITNKVKRQILDSVFNGSVVIYNFIESPNTSLLINTNNEILFPGIYNDDFVVDKLETYSIDKIKNAIIKQNLKIDKTHFTWNHW